MLSQGTEWRSCFHYLTSLERRASLEITKLSTLVLQSRKTCSLVLPWVATDLGSVIKPAHVRDDNQAGVPRVHNSIRIIPLKTEGWAAVPTSPPLNPFPDPPLLQVLGSRGAPGVAH